MKNIYRSCFAKEIGKWKKARNDKAWGSGRVKDYVLQLHRRAGFRKGMRKIKGRELIQIKNELEMYLQAHCILCLKAPINSEGN